jgi:hypothetical protein
VIAESVVLAEGGPLRVGSSVYSMFGEP